MAATVAEPRLVTMAAWRQVRAFSHLVNSAISYTNLANAGVALARFLRFPAWLQSLYNAAQLQCTELDICGALHFVALDPDWNARFVALDPDWNAHPSNIIATTTPATIRARPTITMPIKPLSAHALLSLCFLGHIEGGDNRDHRCCHCVVGG
jgi:hypothetical protein